ncbi:Txe/YoeB family addiction module toxin [Mucilaginibacter sp. BJC16-A38]|uniref:Txe/YoeB family addiction module toxin n=1 Tax=Mucilaginibacter phenanthrenivorans TaxID=1234842 RepID=UPI002157CAEE|nr:Txe/YoeB family addiction module toxin [Mucilaginibacter phenanthrenivorans]MCR8559933.1 Txe/YoeB family addiction module toxin [Mucilaginibacter phenanthrenivorans]
MEIELYKDAKDDLEYWKRSGNKAIQKKIQQLFADMKEHPFDGIGKPEALKYELAGKWSRRINGEHRIVYTVTADVINVYSLKGHY